MSREVSRFAQSVLKNLPGAELDAEGVFDRLGSDNTSVGLTGSNLAANRSMNTQKRIRSDPRSGSLPPS
jgi:hypothetical protein